MKYLAFDIEAANGYMLSSICSVGVVIADESFNILSRENIWINPRTRYNLNGTRPGVGIDLHLDPKLLAHSPDFAKVYPRLKQLLEDPEHIVVGHAVDSDVRMLNKACERYHLPGIDFTFICSQLLYKLYKGEREVKGLGKIADEIGLEFCQHNSEEDAYASMMTLKYISEQTGLTPMEMLERWHVRRGTNKALEMTRSVSLDGQVSHKHVTQEATAGIREYLRRVKPIGEEYKDVCFCLARSLELSASAELYALLDRIGQQRGRYSARLYRGNYYIAAEDPSESDVMREKRVEYLVEQGLMKVITARDVMEGNI